MNKTEPGSVHFEIDKDHFSEVIGINPESYLWHETCERLNLSSAQRIFFALERSMDLHTHIFKPGEIIAREGQEVDDSHIIMNGYVTVSQKLGKEFRVGSGGVFGLAEGVMDLHHAYTVTAEGMVTTSVISMAKVHRELPRIHKGLQGIERCTMMRILSGAGVSREMTK